MEAGRTVHLKHLFLHYVLYNLDLHLPRINLAANTD